MTSVVDRRRFLLTSLMGAVAAPIRAGAQQAGKIYRIGVLREGSDPLSKPFAKRVHETQRPRIGREITYSVHLARRLRLGSERWDKRAER